MMENKEIFDNKKQQMGVGGYVKRKNEATSLFPNVNVLVVDDDIVNLIVEKKVLRSIGVHADCVTSGREALDMLDIKPYDFVLTDLTMPEMDGRELALIIKNKYPSSRVVIVTGGLRDDVVPDFEDIGVSDFLMKPFSKKELFTLFQAYA